MLNFLARRLLQVIPTLFFVSILIFSLQHLLPGDPALVMAGEERDPAVIEQIRQQYRLDQPVPVQYVYWVKGVLSGDFGESLRIKVPVRDLIAQKLPLRPLFIITSAFLFAMAIKFIGEAVQEFQESAVLPFTELKSAGFLGAIGLNPTVEALSAQILVIVFALATWSVVSRNARLARQDKAAMRAAKG